MIVFQSAGKHDETGKSAFRTAVPELRCELTEGFHPPGTHHFRDAVVKFWSLFHIAIRTFRKQFVGKVSAGDQRDLSSDVSCSPFDQPSRFHQCFIRKQGWGDADNFEF